MILRLLGSARIDTAGPGDSNAEVVLTGGKPLALLAYLLALPGRAATRDQLTELLWADVERESARHTLRQTLWYLRKRTNSDLVVGTGETVQVAADLQSDRQRFLDRLDAGDPEAALAEYHGDFFPDFASPGAAAFEHWADLERQRLRGLYLGAVATVVASRLHAGRARDAVAIARQARERAGAMQSTTRLVIECLWAAGDLVSARLEAEQLRRVLEHDEEEAEPSTVALFRRLHHAPDLDTDTTASDDGRLIADLVGRDAAFATLIRAFERSRRGSPVHVHISAAAGYGKTRLLDGLAGRLATQRARVVSVRAIPAERTIAFAFASQLAGALVPLRGAAAVSPEAASTLVALTPIASSYLTASPDRTAGDEAQRRRTLALTELLTAVAEDSSLVVLVDDVHWMDVASRQMLAAVSERVTTGRLLLVTTARPVDRFIELTPRAERVTLDPLTVDDVGALVSSLATLPGAPWAELLPARLHAATTGSPLLIVETVQLALERQLVAIEDGEWVCRNPGELLAILGAGRAIQQRLAALPAAASDALLAMAIAGEPVTDDALSALLGMADTREATALLEARGLAVRTHDTWRAAHDEIAQLVMDTAAAQRRQAMHRAVAEWLEGQPTAANAWPLARATWHRHRSGDASGMRRAFHRLVERTRGLGYVTPASELARDALGADADEGEIRRLVASLPRRLRRRGPVWLRVSAAAALGLLAGGAYWSHAASPDPQEISIVTVVTDDHGEYRWAEGRIAPAELLEASSVDLDSTVAPLTLASATTQPTISTPTLAEGGVTDLYVNPQSSMDLFDFRDAAHPRPLVAKPHDQFAPRVSPDGQLVAFLDRDYWPSQVAEIGVVDRRTGETRRLTNDSSGVISVAWSPTGRELAFVREGRDTLPRQLCRIGLQDASPHCVATVGAIIPMRIVTWRPDGRLLLEGPSRETDRTMLALAAFDDSPIVPVDEGAAMYLTDPSGVVALCECRVRGYDRPIAAAFLVDQPVRKLPLRLNGALLRSLNPSLIRWNVHRETPVSVEIVPVDSIVVGETVQLALRARGATGREVGVRQRRWASLDPALATVDSAGEVHALQPGQVRVVATTGEGLADTVSLVIAASSARIVLSERWRDPLGAGWYAYGDPLPFVAPTEGQRTLHLNGDANLVSGVFSRVAIDATHGVGVRVRFALRVTRSTWQAIAVALRPVAPDTTIRRWLATDGDVEPPQWSNDACTMRLPQQEGVAFRRLVSITADGERVARRRMPPTFGDGEPHELQIQRFSDGRCAFVLDDVLLAVSESASPIDQPMRVVIHGQAVATDARILAVELWQGVRTDGVWAELRRR